MGKNKKDLDHTDKLCIERLFLEYNKLSRSQWGEQILLMEFKLRTLEFYLDVKNNIDDNMEKDWALQQLEIKTRCETSYKRLLRLYREKNLYGKLVLMFKLFFRYRAIKQ